LDSAALDDPVIVGTAGHIDHGKSALVTALTGHAVDRLMEERRRGITIDLNFAPLDLGDGVVGGVVDVPGHEDFVRTMVAGASGFDLALLVVAADEGMMPQTEEHLAILEQLAIPVGIPVVTKADLVESDWLELVVAEISERLGRSSVVFDQPAVVSAVTGLGIEELRARLRDHAAKLAPRARSDVFRLPVDRAFSVAGVGTVVTGTAWSGSISMGEAVRVMPGQVEARVRSIESHGRPVKQTEPGARIALGLVGIERSEVGRGQVLVTPDVPWCATTALDVELAILPSADRPMAARTRARLHLGTTEVMVRVLPRAPIHPGERGLARLRLESPAVARGGDRFVLRSWSPVTTIGGGRVLDPDPPLRRPAWPDSLTAADPADRLRALVERRTNGLPVASVSVVAGAKLDADSHPAAIEGLQVIGGVLIVSGVVEQTVARAVEIVEEFHRSHQVDPGMPLETLRRRLRVPEWLAGSAIDSAARSALVVIDGGIIRRAGFEARVAGGEPEVQRVVRILQGAGLTPPSVAELERETGRRDVAAALRLAASRGLVEAVERDRYYATEALHRFAETVREVGRAGDIQPAAIRERLGISRKYLIPLLEWADARGITVRAGDIRRLAREQN
jgi:selenocysteine-specific elongation factor